jgi:hypothetical protein
MTREAFMAPDLTTTNLLLAIMAAVSALEGLALVAVFAGGFLFYRRIMQTIAGIEARQIAPVAARVNAILDDVKVVTGVAGNAAGTADAGVRRGIAWLLTRIFRAR